MTETNVENGTEAIVEKAIGVVAPIRDGGGERSRLLLLRGRRPRMERSQCLALESRWRWYAHFGGRTSNGYNIVGSRNEALERELFEVRRQVQNAFFLWFQIEARPFTIRAGSEEHARHTPPRFWLKPLP